jgi:hypothetical protein
MLTDLATQYQGITAGPAAGWVMHFVLGSVGWGVGLVVLNKHLPGSNQVIKGNALAFVAESNGLNSLLSGITVFRGWHA